MRARLSRRRRLLLDLTHRGLHQQAVLNGVERLMVLHVDGHGVSPGFIHQIVGVIRNNLVVTPDHPEIRSSDCVAHLNLLSYPQ